MPSRATSLVGEGAVVGVVGAAAELVTADASVGSAAAAAAEVVTADASVGSAAAAAVVAVVAAIAVGVTRSVVDDTAAEVARVELAAGAASWPKRSMVTLGDTSLVPLVNSLATTQGAGMSLGATPSVSTPAAVVVFVPVAKAVPTGCSTAVSAVVMAAAVMDPVDERLPGEKTEPMSNGVASSPRGLLRLFDPSPNDEIMDTGVRGGSGELRVVGLAGRTPTGLDVAEEAGVGGDAGAAEVFSIILTWRARWSRSSRSSWALAPFS